MATTTVLILSTGVVCAVTGFLLLLFVILFTNKRRDDLESSGSGRTAGIVFFSLFSGSMFLYNTYLMLFRIEIRTVAFFANIFILFFSIITLLFLLPSGSESDDEIEED